MGELFEDVCVITVKPSYGQWNEFQVRQGTVTKETYVRVTNGTSGSVTLTEADFLVLRAVFEGSGHAAR